MKIIVTALFTFFTLSVVAQESIYNTDKPLVFNVWNRVADFSPILRSVEAAELSPDGKYAASGSKFGYKVMLWRVADGALIWENEHDSEVECITFSPDGKTVASGGEDYMLRLWDVETGKEIKSIEHNSSLDGLAWSPDGKTIACGLETGNLYLWNAQTLELIHDIKTGSTINSIHFTKDSKRAIVGGNIQTPDPKTKQTIYTGFTSIIDTETGKELNRFEDFDASVKSVRFSPDEKLFATGGFDKKARIFEISSGKLLKTIEEPERIEAVAFSSDGNFLLLGGHQNNISFYKTSDYSLVYKIATPRTEYIHFSNDGRLILTAHEDSGLLSLFLMASDTQQKQGFYQQKADAQLNNRDLKN